MTTLVLVCWLLIIGLCQLGIWHPKFRETLLQYFGLWGLSFYGFTRVDRIFDGRHVSEEAALLAVSLLLYGLGVAVKTWRHRNDPPRPPVSVHHVRRVP